MEEKVCTFECMRADPNFAHLSDDEIRQLLKDIKVFCRVLLESIQDEELENTE